jgi:hypothetical protein
MELAGYQLLKSRFPFCLCLLAETIVSGEIGFPTRNLFQGIDNTEQSNPSWMVAAILFFDLISGIKIPQLIVRITIDNKGITQLASCAWMLK